MSLVWKIPSFIITEEWLFILNNSFSKLITYLIKHASAQLLPLKQMYKSGQHTLIREQVRSSDGDPTDK